MALMFLCHFRLFGMCMLLWILLDAGWMCDKGIAKQKVVGRNLVVEQKKEEQQSI
jgi:hypothetical protein